MLVGPIALGVLLVEGIFAARGQSGDVFSLPAAGTALVLLWIGIAWALRSLLALVMTFVPAIMMTLGAAMIGALAPGAGTALLLIGAALIGATIYIRLSAPQQRWTPGWSAGPGAPGRQGAAGSWPREGSGGSGWPSGPPAGSGLSGLEFGAMDPPGGRFPSPDPSSAQRAGMGRLPHVAPPHVPRQPPAWDTSGTDRHVRHDFVTLVRRRGGAQAPTLATLAEFFTGNGDPRSIAPGLRGALPLARFHDVLQRLHDHPDVAELLVQVEPLEPGPYPAGEWPVAGSVHLITTLGAAEIDALVEPLHPEPSIGPLPVDELAGGAPAPPDSGEIAVWWS